MLNFVVVLSVVLLVCHKAFASYPGVAVQLFEWSWADVSAECENVLSKKGFRAVQVWFWLMHAHLSANKCFIFSYRFLLLQSILLVLNGGLAIRYIIKFKDLMSVFIITSFLLNINNQAGYIQLGFSLWKRRSIQEHGCQV